MGTKGPFITFYNILGVYEKHKPENVRKEKDQSSNLNMRDIQKDIQIYKRCTGGDIKMTSVHMLPREPATTYQDYFNNDPSAGSPTETLLRLLLPLNDQV